MSLPTKPSGELEANKNEGQGQRRPGARLKLDVPSGIARKKISIVLSIYFLFVFLGLILNLRIRTTKEGSHVGANAERQEDEANKDM